MENKKKKNPAVKIILIVILAVAVCVFLFAGYKLLTAYSAYNESKDSYEDIRNMFTRAAEHETASAHNDESNSTEETSDPDDDGFEWDYAKLLEINPDAIGYIRMRGEGDDIIDYPIVQGSDNDFYLTHMFDKTPNKAGAIFMDAAITAGFDADYTILYGHNMFAGSRMFSCLTNYDDPEYFRAHPEIDIYAGDKHYVYKVFAQFKASVYGFVYNNIYPDQAGLNNIINESLNNSAIDAGLPADYFRTHSHIVALSTCTDQYNAEVRYVVMLVRDREVTR